MATEVWLKPSELADVYALRTLYDYAVQAAPEMKLGFINATNLDGKDVPSHLLKGIPQSNDIRDHDNVITVHSDIGNHTRYPHLLEVDASLLKNSVIPKTDGERKKLRRKYSVRSAKPVLVISYSINSFEVLDIINAVKGLARVIMVGGTTRSDLEASRKEYAARGKMQNTSLDNIVMRYVTKRGFLRDYYALADASVNCCNLRPTASAMHNFVEATEGGPHFIVHPINPEQYGFKELKKARAIRAFRSKNILIRGLVQYLTHFHGREKTSQMRSEHLKCTRETYLPLILDYARHVFCGKKKPKSSLKVECLDDGHQRIIRLTHPDTDWGRAFLWYN